MLAELRALRTQVRPLEAASKKAEGEEGPTSGGNEAQFADDRCAKLFEACREYKGADRPDIKRAEEDLEEAKKKATTKHLLVQMQAAERQLERT